MTSFLRIVWEGIRQCVEYVLRWACTWFSDKKGRCRTEDEFVSAEQALSYSSTETVQWVTAPIEVEGPQCYTLKEIASYRKKNLEFLSHIKESSDNAEDRILFLLEEGYFQVSCNILGEGGFGQVREADFWNKEGNFSRMAVKIINPQRDSEDWDCMANELAVLQSVCNPKASAPNIIQAFGVIASRNSLFILMELAERGSVTSYIKKLGALQGPLCKTWFGQVSRGLCYLHHLGIAHKDLKCGNILITHDNTLKICDFGLIEFCHDGTLSDYYVGTPGYQAPEVTRMTPHDAKAADIWSMGVILYVFLHADLPFPHMTSLKQLAKSTSYLAHWKETYGRDEGKCMEEATVQFLFQLLEYHPQKRLTIEQVCCHNWIQQKEKSIHCVFGMLKKYIWPIPAPSSETMSSMPAISE